MRSLYLLDNDAFTGYRGIGVDIAVEGDVEKPADNVDVPGNRNVDRPEFRKDFGMATNSTFIILSLKISAQL